MGSRIATLMTLIALSMTWVRCDSHKEFECYQRARNEAFRECAPELTACATKGCFATPKAFCFKGTSQVVCTPSVQECEGWRADWIKVGRADAKAVCYEAMVREYPAD